MVLDPLKVKKEMLYKDQFGFQPVDIFFLYKLLILTKYNYLTIVTFFENFKYQEIEPDFKILRFLNDFMMLRLLEFKLLNLQVFQSFNHEVALDLHKFRVR